MTGSRGWMLRLTGLLSAGALGVHQLRYLIAFGDHARVALDTHSHGYLVPLAPLLAGVVAVVLAGLVSRAARGGAPAPRLLPLWAGATMTLVAVYCAQEGIEGSSILGHGGWLAAPLAALVGLVVALVMRGASAPAGTRERPWRAPAAPARQPVRVVSLLGQARGGAPRAVAVRGPPSMAL